MRCHWRKYSRSSRNTKTKHKTKNKVNYVLTHSAIRPSQQWDATAGWAGPYTNGANDHPIEQWAQPIHHRVTAAPPSYVFPLLELVIYS